MRSGQILKGRARPSATTLTTLLIVLSQLASPAVRSTRSKTLSAASRTASWVPMRATAARSAQLPTRGAPATVKRKAQGNPIAAGVIAFGLGMLVSSLIPSSEKERQAVSQLQENLEPMKEKATEVARDMGESLKPAAQDAAESVKSTAQEGVESVRQEGQSAAQDVRDQAQQSKETVQQQTS